MTLDFRALTLSEMLKGDEWITIIIIMILNETEAIS